MVWGLTQQTERKPPQLPALIPMENMHWNRVSHWPPLQHGVMSPVMMSRSYLVTHDDRLMGSSVKVALTLQTRITNTNLLTILWCPDQFLHRLKGKLRNEENWHYREGDQDTVTRECGSF